MQCQQLAALHVAQRHQKILNRAFKQRDYQQQRFCRFFACANQRQRNNFYRHCGAALGAAAGDGVGGLFYQQGVAEHQRTFVGQIKAQQCVNADAGQLGYFKTGQPGKLRVDGCYQLLMV